MSEYKILLDKLEVIIKETLPDKVTNEWMQDVFSIQKESLALDIESILKPAKDLIERGGKRWRPILMLLLLESWKIKLEKEHYELSLCIELPHNGSLIIDDIEDNSDTRRGEPSIHKIYGEDISINTGNLLYFLPTYLLDKATSVDESTKYKLSCYWLKTMRRLHLGQGLDITWHNTPFYLPSKEDYLDMCRCKTGAMAGLAGYWGAILAGKEEKVALQVADILERIGVGFQIIDDSLNLKTGNVGKKRGDDLLEGKKSYPLLVYTSTKENPSLILEEIKSLKLMKNKTEQEIMIDSIISQLEESEAIKISLEEGKTIIETAKEELNLLLEDSPSKEAIFKMFSNF